jgi:hypothetical protein
LKELSVICILENQLTIQVELNLVPCDQFRIVDSFHLGDREGDAIRQISFLTSNEYQPDRSELFGGLGNGKRRSGDEVPRLWTLPRLKILIRFPSVVFALT